MYIANEYHLIPSGLPMFRAVLFTLFLILIQSPTAGAQVQLYPNLFRPSNLDWQLLKTRHFRVIYPLKAQKEAFQTALILESEYSDISGLTGGTLNNFRMIINTENDRSNGFVNPLNFRSEIELAPIKGKNMNPRSGNWLETVVPHELVHAAHFNSVTPSLTNIAGLFSPDIRRSVHSAAPFGILEGIAVEYESHNHIEGAGRGNYPFFTNQYQALIGTPDEWSMGQLVHVSEFTFPFDRHYNGGYHFVHWLLENKGLDVMSEAIRFHYKWPFLGFGYALKQKTSHGPAELYKEYQSDIGDQELLRRSQQDKIFKSSAIHLEPVASGMRARRPLWLDNNQFIFHSRFYDAPTGFYIYDLENKSHRLTYEVTIVDDYKYSLSSNRNELYYGRYKTDPLYDNTFRANIYKLLIDSGKVKKVTRSHSRIFAPEYSEDTIYALQTDGQINRPVILDSNNGEIRKSIQLPEGYTIQEVDTHPEHPNRIAILAKKSGVQGIWITSADSLEQFYKDDPDIVFEKGSVFDPKWHPAQAKLLFTSDHSGVMNIYLYDLEKKAATRLTHSIYNSMEPAFSPDGNRVAYIISKGEEFIPAVMKFQPDVSKAPDLSFSTVDKKVTGLMNRPVMNRDVLPDSTEWSVENYSSGLRWLKPRLWTPVVRNTGDVRELGLRFYSTDDLARNTYSLELTGAKNRVWYDLNYQYSGFFPGIGFQAKSEPLFPSLRVDSETGQSRFVNFLLQNREFGINIPFRFFLERNTRFSSVSIQPEYEISQLKFFDFDTTNNSLSNFSTSHSVGFTVVFNYRLRQFIRDVQPNSGWVFYTQSEIDLNKNNFNFSFNDTQFSGEFSKRRGLRGGVYRYLSILPRKNQSLRLGAEFLTQTDIPQYDNQDLVSDLFPGSIFRSSNNMSFLSTRYTIPLIYPDDGGFLLPLYLSNLYIVLVSQTVSDLNSGSFSELRNNSRTILGAGLRSRFRISNLSIDLGISIGFEPSRNDVTFLFGTF